MIVAAKAAHGTGEAAGPLEADKFFRPVDGQQAQENLVEEREDRRVGADAQSQRDDHSEREGRGLAQLAERVADVVKQRVHRLSLRG